MAETRDIALSGIAVSPDRVRKLRPELVAELAASIAACGLLHPIILRPSRASGYWLVVGRHRLEAVRRLKHETIRAEIVTLDTNQALLAEIDENLMRGELTPVERVDHIGRRYEIYQEKHLRTRHGGAPGKAGGGKQKLTKDADSASFVPTFAAATAAKTGRSARAVQEDQTRFKTLKEDLGDLVGTSLDKGEELDALRKLSDEQRRGVIDKAKAGEKVSAKQALKWHKRAEREVAMAVAAVAAGDDAGHKVYGVIYADPPWRFEPYSRETGMDRAADNHYPTMTLDAIKALDVPAAADCVLFLWATPPMLSQALEVMAAWGFAYKSHVVWLKDKIGTGYWFRNQHELLLLGVKGEVPALAPGGQCASVISAKRTRHSAKPPAFAEIIEDMFPTVPRLEMFARDKRLGWEVWGNEVMA